MGFRDTLFTLQSLSKRVFGKAELNLNIQKFKVQVRKMWFRAKRMPRSVQPKKGEKEKRVVIARNVDSERSGEGSSQDLSPAAAATALITEKSSEPQSADMSSTLPPTMSVF